MTYYVLWQGFNRRIIPCTAFEAIALADTLANMFDGDAYVVDENGAVVHDYRSPEQIGGYVEQVV